MSRFYGNENFPRAVVERLRELGHDVLTSAEAGNANVLIPDSDVLRFAAGHGRAVLTQYRKDFMRLHRGKEPHVGIVVCTVDPDSAALADRIHDAVTQTGSLNRKLVRVTRGGWTTKDEE